MEEINVLIVDDHSIVRDGIKLNLENHLDIKVVAEASDGKEALDFLTENTVDLVLMDVTMPVMTGLEALEKLSKAKSQTKCVMFSMHDDESYILESLKHGAFGYLLKDSSIEELVKAIRTVAKGDRYYSTPVSKIIAEGYIKQINNPSSSTDGSSVKSESKNILSKREQQVLEMLGQGKTNKEISDDLKLSIRTVEVHRFNMMKKLGAKNIVELLKVASEKGLI